MSEWWKSAVCYQIYPRSFQDSNADGIGDLDGITRRLDYLNDGTPTSLGVDAIWLSPTFPSPMKDFGYDVADYVGVDPMFGDLDAMDRLIVAAHERGIRVLLDYVPNHSSDLHPWFLDSRSSRTAAKRDWYVWRDAKPDGSPPNNWISNFGGPAWTWDEGTGQYYLHSFLREQPDLNWRNPEVVAAMHDVLRFWLARGIDGFRVDVMGMVMKDPAMPDEALNPNWHEGMLPYERLIHSATLNYPDVFDVVRDIRSQIDEFPHRMAVGEVFGPPEVLTKYLGGEALDGLHLAFNFNLLAENSVYTPWEAREIRRIVTDYERELVAGAQPCYALNNHDRSRFVSRHMDDGRGHERGRAAALLLLGLRSTPFLYQGEELGMVDVRIPENMQQDPARFHSEGRDPVRTPMQWDASPGFGFTTGTPWLPFGADSFNAEAQRNDPDSMLALYRDAIWQRKAHGALAHGTLSDVTSVEDTFVFVREAEGEGDRPVLVAINTATEAREIPLPTWASSMLLCSLRHLDGQAVSGTLRLPGLAGAWVE